MEPPSHPRTPLLTPSKPPFSLQNIKFIQDRYYYHSHYVRYRERDVALCQCHSMEKTQSICHVIRMWKVPSISLQGPRSDAVVVSKYRKSVNFVYVEEVSFSFQRYLLTTKQLNYFYPMLIFRISILGYIISHFLRKQLFFKTGSSSSSSSKFGLLCGY